MQVIARMKVLPTFEMPICVPKKKQLHKHNMSDSLGDLLIAVQSSKRQSAQ
jgi:hypothetical protein